MLVFHVRTRILAMTFYLVFFLCWLMLVSHLTGDIVRSHEQSGPGKAGWVIFILVLPWLGSLVYLVLRGGSMHERQARGAPPCE